METKRGLWARAGIVLLNLLVPGLGLLRLGRWKAAIGIYVVTLLALLFLMIAPEVPFFILALVPATVLASLLVAMVLSWRWSRTRRAITPGYSRWYALTAAALVAMGVNLIAAAPGRMAYHPFYLASDSMAPTLLTNDRIMAYMRSPDPVRRGQLLVVRAGQGIIYVKRAVALPGDRISLTDGIVSVNGIPVDQQFIRREKVNDLEEPAIARRLSEQFPGEAAPHMIYDLGVSEGDEFAEQIVRPGHIFVLGDNRDRSLDSRFGKGLMGLEQVPDSDILGYPLYFSWGSSKPIGTPLH